MGATNFHDTIKKGDLTAKQAYAQLVQEAIDYNGQDPYNGTISTTRGFFTTRKPKDDDAYDDLLDRTEKWGACACYEDGDDYVFMGWAAC